jgi:hypothetical protein
MTLKSYGLEELRAAVAHADSSAARVSKWSVGMHIHHCCLGMMGICRVLSASQPPPPGSRFSLAAAFVFLTGRIPRGRGKAAEVVLPKQDVSQEELSALLDESERMLAAARELDRGAWFEHFAFGVLARDRALRFVEIHNRHHLRIISDIGGARG